MTYFTINYGIMFIAMIITLVAQALVTSSYKKYSKIKNSTNITGAEVARKILDKNDLKDVYVVETKGYLTDHYDPTRKVVRLSSNIYHGTSIASVAVASHECGHAIQDKESYAPMRIRSSLVPITNFASYTGYIAIFIGFIFNSNSFFWLGIVLLCIILLFQLVTLPVEFDASKRALKKIQQYALVNELDLGGSKSMLTAAAFTYVASLATTLLQILRLILLRGNRD